MSARLRYVDPNRTPSLFSRIYAALANTRLGRFMSVHVVWKVDPYLMRATRGRLGLGLAMPTALLEMLGAKTGELRRNGDWRRSGAGKALGARRPGLCSLRRVPA
jgi:hypothetical protein